jgi:RNA polymerase sigma-70 factor (ECF subfamily)
VNIGWIILVTSVMTPPLPIVSSASADLAGRIERGDAAAENELAQLFWPRVLALLASRTHDRETARELCTDVLMAVLRALRRGRLNQPDRLVGFVLGTARNLANNHVRTRRQRPIPEPLPEELAQEPAPDAVELRERAEALRGALAHLAPIDRHILHLVVVDGQRSGEVAAQLGLSPEVVRARKCRALKRLSESERLRPAC